MPEAPGFTRGTQQTFSTPPPPDPADKPHPPAVDTTQTKEA